MPSIRIVKRSDVSFGTALHYAIDWSYGRDSLCGQTMRAFADSSEIGLKKVCGNCARVLASQVEKAHAEALKMNAPQATVTPGAKLSPAMTKGLIHFRRTGNWDGVRTGTVVALLDRGLVTHSRQGISPDVITDWGIDALVRLGELSYVSDECRHTVPVGGCADCEHAVETAHAEALRQHGEGMTDRDRLIEQGKTLGLPASALLMDTEALRARVEVVADAVAARENTDCPPVCEHGASSIPMVVRDETAAHAR